MGDIPRVPQRTWEPEKQLADLMSEAEFYQGEAVDAVATTAQLLREYAPTAALSIAHLAAHARNERVRFQAASFVVDRALGGKFDADLRMQAAQVQIVGQAVFALVRALSLRFGFDPDTPEVREVAHRALLQVSSKGGEQAA